MDYPYENLTPEKFQLFCQGLLAKEYPDLQCLPVAQPDGGRDAMQWLFLEHAKEFVMFQVKFVRHLNEDQEPLKWIQKILTGEGPKVKTQISKGAKRYVLITNVRGTAHPDTGSIDSINSFLSKELGIPSLCWWRDDLNRRLDNAWDIKWTYPELMTGPDLIRLVIESGLSESRERRGSAIKSFVASQYNLEQEVKFKQIDLQNRLLDLFIDVPVDFSHRAERFNRLELFQRDIFELEVLSNEPEVDSEEEFPNEATQFPSARFPSRQIGSATLLLSSKLYQNHPLVILEGAPGQGKSTITQYVCQVHRMRLLDKAEDIGQISDDHRDSPIRLPVKVDLRDFATWLLKKNPFSAEGEELSEPKWQKSLEGFLAALISHQSGGTSFDVSDLQAVFRLSAVILVLDGLDEVADIKRRAEVVDEIVKGVSRLQALAASLQVVVTSRPAAFANSPGFPEKDYEYFSLDSVTYTLIDKYADQWLRARRLKERESSVIKRILREKLKQPHLRDLARNPMQLAILLSLIHTRGTSLPDKRTALYDSYIELFFNREAEKSDIVRDNRDLLIDIHRYLAWLLHTEAEQSSVLSQGPTNGAIEESRLRKILKSYLISEGYNASSLPDELFTGVVERVVALVSRVQGTYEFEVQPLREYFAARFLYETAPYSPVGSEKKGTKPDRFDAISRNFYWLNVTRFYAGCYSKGELASLIDRLSELIRDPDFQYLSHPRILAATLLGDWVFNQHPKSVTEVIRIMLDGLGLRFLLTSSSPRLTRSQPLILPEACGRAELVEKCLKILDEDHPADYAFDALDLLRSNTTRAEILPAWRQRVRSVKGKARTSWLRYGLRLGCLSDLSISEFQDLLSESELTCDRVDILLKGRRSGILEASHNYFKETLEYLLACRIPMASTTRPKGLLESFSQALDPRRYSVGFQVSPSGSLAELWARSSRLGINELPRNFEVNSEYPEFSKCVEIVGVAVELAKIDVVRWANELNPWEILVQAIEERFPGKFASSQLANIGSGIKSATETCVDCSDLFDESKSLCRRVRYARLRAGNPAWWAKELEKASLFQHKMLASLIWFTWVSPSTVAQNLSLIDNIITQLSVELWEALFDSLELAVELTRTQSGSRVMDFDCSKLAPSISQRTFALLYLRSKKPVAEWIYNNKLKLYDGKDLRILKICQMNALNGLVTKKGDVKEELDILARSYSCGVLSPRSVTYNIRRHFPINKIPRKVAEAITGNAESYPSFLVAAAEFHCRNITAQKIKPVAEVAKEECWFD